HQQRRARQHHRRHQRQHAQPHLRQRPPGHRHNGTNTNNNVVQGNYIGTNPAGSAAMGNTWAGIGVWGGAQNNTIGGTTASARNIISGNLEDGVAIRDTNTSSNTVAGNYIGTDVNGTFAVANGWYGVDIFAAATNNTVGGN